MATPTSAEVLPSNYSEPLATVDSHNRSAWIIITVVFQLVVTTCCIATRAYVRLKTTSALGNDDAFFAAAFVSVVIQSGMALGEVQIGFGDTIEDIDRSQLEPAQQYGYVAILFFILGLYLAKASVLVLYKRLSDQLFPRIFWIGLGMGLLSCGIASFLLVALTCELSQPWLQYTRDCPTLEVQWKAVTAFDIATEVALIGVAVYLVWGLQMPIGRKLKSSSPLQHELPITCIHLHYFTEQITSSDPTLTGAVASVIRQVALGFALLSALIPCLRPFLTVFHTDFMAMGGNTISNGSHIGNLSASRSKNATQRSKDDYHLKSLDTQKEDRSPSERMEKLLRPGGLSHKTHISSKEPNVQPTPDSDSITSHGSQRHIIRKTTEWNVESNSGRSM